MASQNPQCLGIALSTRGFDSHAYGRRDKVANQICNEAGYSAATAPFPNPARQQEDRNHPIATMCTTEENTVIY